MLKTWFKLFKIPVIKQKNNKDKNVNNLKTTITKSNIKKIQRFFIRKTGCLQAYYG